MDKKDKTNLNNYPNDSIPTQSITGQPNNYNNTNHENDKELLIKELSENLNIEFDNNDNNKNINNAGGIKQSLTTIQEEINESISNPSIISGKDKKKEENELFYYLLREELWPIEDWKNKDLIEKDLELLKHNNIKISNCYEFYKLLGENESEEILRGIDLNPKIKKRK